MNKTTSHLIQIQKILSQNQDLQPKISIEDIKLETRFRDDLGFDSLATASLFYELQEHYPHLEEKEITKWVTIQDCIKSMSKNETIR